MNTDKTDKCAGGETTFRNNAGNYAGNCDNCGELAHLHTVTGSGTLHRALDMQRAQIEYGERNAARSNQCPVCKSWFMSQRQLIAHATKRHNWLPSKDGKTAYLTNL